MLETTSKIVYRYTNDYYGDSTQLMYLRARQYSPQMGRFLTRDTWEGISNLPQSYNKWVYGYSNPINYIDSTGKSPKRSTLKQSGGYICPASYNWHASWPWQTPDQVFSREQCARLIEIWNNPSPEGAAEMEAWYYKLSNRMSIDGYTQASKLLKHFLDGTGVDSPASAPFQLDSDFMKDEVMAYDEVNDKVNDLKEWYLKTHANCSTPTSGPDYFYTGILQQGGKDVIQHGISKSLFAALNAFRLDAVIRSQNTPWKYVPIGANWNIDLHFVAIDKYDWTPGQTAPYGINGPVVEDDWALLLVRYGLASNFYVRGDYYDKWSTWSFISNSSVSLPGSWNSGSCVGENMPLLSGTCWNE